MAKQKGRKSVPRREFKKYFSTAEHFYEAARDSMELEYWTAAGVLIVHSAIAFSDALCIKLGGVRSTADDHEDAIALLESAAAQSKDKTKAINHFKRKIEEKNESLLSWRALFRPTNTRYVEAARKIQKMGC